MGGNIAKCTSDKKLVVKIFKELQKLIIKNTKDIVLFTFPIIETTNNT